MASDAKLIFRARGRVSFPSTVQTRKALSQKIVDLILGHTAFVRARWVSLFFPQRWEVELLGVWKQFPEKCVFPRVEHGQMDFYRIRHLTDLSPSYGGIPAPPANLSLKVDRWGPEDIVLVPGLQFDSWGGRVGSGKGYYDRFLSPKAVQKWGICWQSQISDLRLPQEANDVSMDALCTETGWRWVGT